MKQTKSNEMSVVKDASKKPIKGNKKGPPIRHHHHHFLSGVTRWVNHIVFQGIPESYSFSKKLTMLLNRSSVGKTWDWIIVLTSLIASAWYVANTYTNQSWKAVMIYKAADIVFTSIYVTDAIISFLLAPSPMRYAMSFERILDIGTLVPYFIDVSYSYDANRVRETRVLRLLRFLRISRGLKNQHGARRQIYHIFYFILCLLFVGAGMVQLMENDVRQAFQYHCKYSTAATNWIASCSPDLPFSAYENPLNPDFWCDCKNWNCHTYYLFFDKPKQPTAVQCIRLTFFDTLYFMVVTVATLGYGDIAPSTELSRAIVMAIIIMSIIFIPMQVQRLAAIYYMSSAFRRPYVRAHSDEKHVIICGHVADRTKMERFLKEFYHPTRLYRYDTDIKVLMLSPMEPSEDIKDMLAVSSFENKVSYLVGSALSIDDLCKAGAQYASAIFVFCNPVTHEDNAALDDAANVLRALSVTNFNPSIELFVQIIRSEDREMLRTSNVDVVLCLDEFRTAMQARNALCPGLSTLIENLFQTFGEMGNDKKEEGKKIHRWTDDYIRGAEMEVYYVKLGTEFMQRLSYCWSLMTEGIFLEWNIILLGVGSYIEQNIILNPSSLEMSEYDTKEAFFGSYDTCILICDSQEAAEAVAKGMTDPDTIEEVVAKLLAAETLLHCRTHSNEIPEEEQKAKSLWAKVATEVKLREEGEEESRGGGGINWNSFAAVLKKEVTTRRSQTSAMTQRLGRMGRHISRQFSTIPVYNPNALDEFVTYDEQLSILSTAHIDQSTNEQLHHHTDRVNKEELYLGYEKPELNVANKMKNAYMLGTAFVTRKVSVTQQEPSPSTTAAISPSTTAAASASVLTTSSTPNVILAPISSAPLSLQVPTEGGGLQPKPKGGMWGKVAATGNKAATHEAVVKDTPTPTPTPTPVVTTPAMTTTTSAPMITMQQQQQQQPQLADKHTPIASITDDSTTNATTRINSTGGVSGVSGVNESTMFNVSGKGVLMRRQSSKATGRRKREGDDEEEAITVSPVTPQPQPQQSPGNASHHHHNNNNNNNHTTTSSGSTTTEGMVIPINRGDGFVSEKEKIREETTLNVAAAASAVAGTASATSATTTVSKNVTSPTTTSPPVDTTLEEEEDEDGTKLSTFPGVGVVLEVETPSMFTSIASPGKKGDKTSQGSVRSIGEVSVRSVGSQGVSVKAVGFQNHDDDGDGGTGGDNNAPAQSSQKGMSLRDRLAGKTGTVASSGKEANRKGSIGKETVSPDFGDRSRKIESASFLSNHVVVFGSPLNIEIFVAEIRRPIISLCCYRPILYVGTVVPEQWESLTLSYDDVYWLSGDLRKATDFNRANISKATSVVHLADRNKLARVDDEDLDADTLFTYLKLEKHIPMHVFFTAELTFESNMVVLNTNVIQHQMQNNALAAKNLAEEKNVVEAMASKGQGLATVVTPSSMKSNSPKSNYSSSNINNNSMRSGNNSPTNILPGSLKSQMSFKKLNRFEKAASRVYLGGSGGLGGLDMTEEEEEGKHHMNEENMGEELLGTTRREKAGGGDGRGAHGGNNAHRSMDNVLDGNGKKAKNKPEEKAGFFSILHTHHTLPVFASGRAFVPSALDTILSVSFFDVFTPLLCERLVSGQQLKTMFQLHIPRAFIGRCFLDLFRAFNSKHILVVALYRAPQEGEQSVLPFVYTCPRPGDIIHQGDRLIVYASPVELDFAMNQCLNLNLISKANNGGGPPKTYLATSVRKIPKIQVERNALGYLRWDT